MWGQETTCPLWHPVCLTVPHAQCSDGIRGPYLLLTHMVNIGGQRAGRGEEAAWERGPGQRGKCGLGKEAGLQMTPEGLRGGKLHPLNKPQTKTELV